MTMTDATLFDALGGDAAIDATVELFYAKVLDDPALAPFFAGIDVRRLKAHQRAFLLVAFGAEDRYRGRDMATAHAALPICHHHFDLVAGHLVATLEELGVDADLIRQVVEIVGPLRDVIVHEPARQPAS